MTIADPAFSDAAPPLTGGCRMLHLPAEEGSPGLTLWINTPPATARPDPGWPALILLDGEAYFTAAAEMAQRLARRTAKTRVGPLMVVGLMLDDSSDRPATFSLQSDGEGSPAASRGRSLLDRLSADVLPLIEAAGADVTNLTLMGHSMSGLFVLEARAVAAPFARYVAISPSIWANPSVVAAQPSGSAKADDLFVAVGGQEEMDGLTQAHLGRRMISNARTLVGKGGVRFKALDEDDHGSTPYASLPAALRFASQR